MNIEFVGEYVSWGSEIKEYKLTNLNFGGVCCVLSVGFRLGVSGELDVLCSIPSEYNLPTPYIFDYIKYDILLSGFGFSVDDINNMVLTAYTDIMTNRDNFILTLDASENKFIWNNLLDSYFIWSNTKL